MAVGIFRYKNLKLFLAGAAAVVVSLFLTAVLFLTLGNSSGEDASSEGGYEAIDSTSSDTDFVDEMEPENIPESNSLPANPFDEVFGSILSMKVDSAARPFRLQQPGKSGRVVNQDRYGNAKQVVSPGSSDRSGSKSGVTNQ
jgi:hypothetical protein